MDKIDIALANSIHWDRNEGDKVYLDSVRLVITDFPFHMRPVSLRFEKGPGLDLSIVDMDRLAIEYLTLRGTKLPAKVRDLLNVEAPPKCDFVVPGHLVSKLKRPEVKSSQKPTKRTKPKRPRPHS